MANEREPITAEDITRFIIRATAIGMSRKEFEKEALFTLHSASSTIRALQAGVSERLEKLRAKAPGPITLKELGELAVAAAQEGAPALLSAFLRCEHTISSLQERLAEKSERVEQVEQAFSEYRGLLTYPEESKGTECPWLYPPQGCGIDGDHGCQWWNCPETRKVGGDPGCALQRREFKNIALQSELAEARKREVPEGCIILEAVVPTKWRVCLDDSVLHDYSSLEPDADIDPEEPLTWVAWEWTGRGTMRSIGEFDNPQSAIAAAESAEKERDHAD